MLLTYLFCLFDVGWLWLTLGVVTPFVLWDFIVIDDVACTDVVIFKLFKLLCIRCDCFTLWFGILGWFGLVIGCLLWLSCLFGWVLLFVVVDGLWWLDWIGVCSLVVCCYLFDYFQLFDCVCWLVCFGVFLIDCYSWLAPRNFNSIVHLYAYWWLSTIIV